MPDYFYRTLILSPPMTKRKGSCLLVNDLTIEHGTSRVLILDQRWILPKVGIGGSYEEHLQGHLVGKPV